MRTGKLTTQAVLLLIVITVFSNGMTRGWDSRPKVGNTGSARATGPTPQNTKQLEQYINERNKSANGINVGKPKVYDDLQLQQMLQNAASRLASMQVLDQTGIAARFGAITGATQQISSLGINLQGPSLPGTQTTVNDANQKTETTTDNAGTKTVVTDNPATRAVVSNVSQANPPAFTAPAPTTTLPSTTFSVSASDILNEQMQLTYEIANLRLLLEGSLSDRYVELTNRNGQLYRIIKPRSTIGFSIAVDPDKRHKDAVAVVEVIVKAGKPLGGEPPAITALLPREKTYNVAAITDRSTSIGGGVVTQILGVSASLLRGRKTYYLAKDQDTVALSFDPEDNADQSKVGFAWQFKPVLGKEYVASGLKQTFVQLAFPTLEDENSLGTVYVRTYWRKYDSKKGVLKEVVPDSVNVNFLNADIRQYPLIPESQIFGYDSLEDIGGGQMLVSLKGNFLSGTYVRIGSTILTSPSPSMTFEPKQIRFIASIADLATKKVYLVGRNGKEVPLEISKGPCNRKINIDLIEISTVDQANSMVKVRINDPCFITGEFQPGRIGPVAPLVLVIGNKVYGYSDAPILRDGNTATLSAVVPTALLLNNPTLSVQTLFPGELAYASQAINYKHEYGSDADYLLSQPDKLVFVGQNPRTSRYEYLLYGNRLYGLQVIDPPDARFTPLSSTGNKTTVGKIELTPAQVNTQKYLLLRRSDDRSFTVLIPPPEIKDKVPEIKPDERVTVGATEAKIIGTGLKDLTKVTFNDVPVKFVKDDDNKSVTLKELVKADVTTTPTVKTLVFWFGDKKTEVKLEVVNAKVETIRQK